MKKIKFLAVMAFGALLLAGNVQSVNAQDVDLEKYPDYKPFDPALQKTMPTQTNRGVAKSESTATRPDHVNNALSMYYPPVFNQTGGSCGSAQCIGYIFTHDMNNMRGLDASYEENQYPSHFTWLFTNAGQDKQTIAAGNGVPNVKVYGGRTNSKIFGVQEPKHYYFGWMQGYDKWFQAMHNRFVDFFYGPKFTDFMGAREQIKQWIWNHWGEKGYNEGGCVGIGVASGVTSAKIPSTSTNDAIGVAGKYYVEKWGKTYDHGLTICGYDDRIEFDLNGNGIYGEESADEKGAWIICNSWGGNWMNQGFIYCPYAHSYSMINEQEQHTLPWNTELYHYRHDYRPLRTIKLNMDYSHRWELTLAAGMSQDTSATAPEKSTNMAHFRTTATYNTEEGVSPECPMLGRWADGFHYEPMEFGYDLTDLGEDFDKTKPIKYFFTVKTVSGSIGTGHVNSASIINYEFDENDPVEIPFKFDTINIDPENHTYTISVIVPGEAVNPPLNAALANNTLSWSSPEVSSLPLQKYYIYKGGELTDSVSSSKKAYTVSDPSGTYAVAAVYKYKNQVVVSKVSNNASAPEIVDNTNNKILTLNQGGITIPNIFSEKLPQATIEFMFKATTLGGSFNRIGNNDNDFFVNLSASGQILAGWNTNNTNSYAATAASTIKAGKWYHVAITINSGEITIYVDGMKKKSVTSSEYNGIPAMGDLVIGVEGGLMNASIDELRIWKTARTLQEVYSGKDEAIANPCSMTDLIAYLPMETIEDQGELKLREYASGHHAYFNNDKYTQATDATILNGSKFAIASAILASQDSASAGTPVKYTARTSLTTTNWTWSTPGAESDTYTSQSPYITYKKAGEYTIKLTYTKADGTSEELTKDIVVTEGQLPVPDFDISSETTPTGDLISFINRSTGANTSYKWTLEGAATPVLYTTNANVAYDAPGTYNVVLTATNATGSVSKTKSIVIYEAAPKTAFSVTPSNILFGDIAYLNDETRGTATRWYWDINNGKTRVIVDGQNSSFTPTAPGIYDVSLTASNDIGQTTSKQPKLLCVSNADALNALNFSGNEKVQFDVPLTTNSKTWTIEWWMNPSQYTGAGSFETENGFFRMYGAPNGVYTIEINGGKSSSSKNYVILNEWHHYAVTYSLGTIRLYRDGELWETPAKLSYTSGNWDGKMTISCKDFPFKGLIDEMRIWSKTVNASTIKANANQPLEDPENASGLTLYYNFNQGSGSVTDFSKLGDTGVRIGFGPDGDAWPIVPGVFTLDQTASASAPKDVTADYLTNYIRPFQYNSSKSIHSSYSSNFFAIAQNSTSTWQVEGAVVNGEVTTGAFVDTRSNSDISLTVGTYGFADEIKDHKLYQTVTLPAGSYTFKVKNGSSYAYTNLTSYVVAAIGEGLPNTSDISTALASNELSDSSNDSTSISFVLPQEATISLGILYNVDYYGYLRIKEFNLQRQDIQMIEADGLTNIYEAIEAGEEDAFKSVPGAIRMALGNKEDVKVYDVNGKCVFNDEVQGVHFVPFAPGIYIVNGKKLLVK